MTNWAKLMPELTTYHDKWSRQTSGVVAEYVSIYGQHLGWCNTIQGWGQDAPCDCGLYDLITPELHFQNQEKYNNFD